MYRELLNQCRLRFTVDPETPLLIRAGKQGLDPTRPDIECVRISSPHGDVPYVPGSSLKGAIRSFSEKALASMETRPRVCNPLDPDSRCKTPDYQGHCPACRTFGSMQIAGRARFLDAMPWSADWPAGERSAGVERIRTERRTNVAIDRASGGAKPGALFDLEVVVTGTFHAEVVLRNYSLWQLGLLGLAIDQMNAGFLQLGSTKSRGLGRVNASIQELHIEQWGRLSRFDEIAGVAADPDTARQRQLRGQDKVAAPTPPALGGIFRRWVLAANPARGLLASSSLWGALPGREVSAR